MVWMYSGIVFIAQLVCCMVFKDKFKRYLPTLIALAFISATVLSANLGQLDPQRMADQTIVCLVGFAAVLLYHCIMAIWGIMLKRRDPAQKLRK